uniref:hypothetical protein n=1 Tax=Ndongobacter massiliensis TaxID=1871025 RepID=UPI000931A6C6|nr:hypothetical protein [Ndongobacter massiliensis]
MQELSTLVGLDQAISTLLSLAWIVVIILIAKHVPGWIERFMEISQEMTRALERQSQVTERNSTLMEKTEEAHAGMTTVISEQTREVQALREVIRTMEEITARVDKKADELHVQGNSIKDLSKEQTRILKELYKEFTGKPYADSF